MLCCVYLDVLFAGLLQLLKSVLSLTWVDGGRRSHAHALLAVRSLGDRLHGVRIPGGRRQAAAVGAWDGSHDTAAHAVRPGRHGLHFVVIAQQLKDRMESNSGPYVNY